MTVPRETMRLIYRAVAFTGQWPWVNFQGSRSWNGVPPGIMKMQLRILRLRLGMTAPRETMRLIFKAGPSTDHPSDEDLSLGPRRRPPVATFAQDDKQKHWVKRWWFSRSLV